MKAKINKGTVIIAAKELLSPNNEHLMTGCGVASFGSVKKNGTINKNNYSSICLAGLPNHHGADVLFHFRKCSHNLSNVHSSFIDWLCGSASPFRELWADWPKEIMVDGHNVMSLEFRKKYGFIFPNMNFTGNLMAAFLTVYRTCYEFEEHAEIWKHLVDYGIDPALAFIWCGYFRGNKNGYNIARPGNENHWIFHLDGVNLKLVKNFMSGTLAWKSPGTFGENGKYRMINPNKPDEHGDHGIFQLFGAKLGKITRLDNWINEQQHPKTEHGPFGGVKIYPKVDPVAMCRKYIEEVLNKEEVAE